MLESLILRWGYLAVGVGTFLEGEAVLVAAGAMAHRGLLRLPYVMLAAFAGSFIGDQVWYQVGKRAGRSLLERSERWKARGEQARRRLARGGTLFVLGFRFIFGIRVATPVLLGATGYPARRFALLNALGAAAWASILAPLGWALGATLQTVLRRAGHVEELIAIAALVAVGVRIVQKLARRRRAT